MPKIRTKRGAAKRVKVTGGGKLKRRRVNLGHILTKKDRRRKRRLSGSIVVKGAMEKKLKTALGMR